MAFLLFSCSLRDGSRSQVMVEALQTELEGAGHEVEYLDLREAGLPLCDGDDCYDHPATKALRVSVAAADGIIFAVPVYNFYASAAAKNIVELGGSTFEGKVVGFICAAGGRNSYMSVMSLANSLMLDFRCHILPRYVYASKDSFSDGKLADPEISGRISEMAHEIVRVSQALAAS
ncbi:MAG: NADPH-dependent FMN reductase [Candidatus Thermoplasmatota archaeon]|nr:NADPH-dependent FMN reductase [Candidatus Thermoplasmatota archaeon]